jgi:hypothetical protein
MFEVELLTERKIAYRLRHVCEDGVITVSVVSR